MPVEGGIFKDVDYQWRVLMSEINANPKAMVVMENQNIGTTLRECFAKLERVQKASIATLNQSVASFLVSTSFLTMSSLKSFQRPRSP
jgi:hypothetical protein